LAAQLVTLQTPLLQVVVAEFKILLLQLTVALLVVLAQAVAVFLIHDFLSDEGWWSTAHSTTSQTPALQVVTAESMMASLQLTS
jgi:hypothetical protein